MGLRSKSPVGALSTISQPLVILGAGPAGLSAAITIARCGCEVIVHERRPVSGGRFVGDDFQGIENWTDSVDALGELESMGIEIDFENVAFCSAYGIAPSGHRTTLSSTKPLFYLVRRGPVEGTLDEGLKRQAMALGVEIRYGSTLPESCADIVATGPRRRQRSTLDIGVAFDTDLADVSYVLLDDRSACRGYSYLIAWGGRGNLCTVVYDRFDEIHRQFGAARRRFEALTGVAITGEDRISGYGSCTHAPVFTRDGRSYVGEAAGLQDPLWGFGIRSAIRSGYLAAQCILEGRDYDAAARKAFLGMVRAGVVNRFLWHSGGNPGYVRFLSKSLRIDDSRRFLNRLYRPSLWRSAMFPFALWRLRAAGWHPVCAPANSSE